MVQILAAYNHSGKTVMIIADTQHVVYGFASHSGLHRKGEYDIGFTMRA